MGSSGSKHYGASSSSTSGGRSGRSKGRRVFQSSCLGSPSGSLDADVAEQTRDHRRSEECGSTDSSGGCNKGESDEAKSDCCEKVKQGLSDDGLSRVSSGDTVNEWHQARITSSASGTGSSSSRASSTRFISGPSRLLSRFSFVPGNVSFRLSRASSLGSSRAYTVAPTHFAMMNGEDDTELRQASARYDTQNSSGLRFDIPESNCLDDVTTASRFSSDGEVRDINFAGVGVDVNLHSPGIFNEVDGVDTRISDRRMGAREPAERNARFSRTLSVGRLRDRVLRRSSLSEQPFCPLQHQRDVIDASQDTDSQAIEDAVVLADASSISGHMTTTSASAFALNFQNHEVEPSRPREHRYHDLLEHRSNFLERRRRVRSQVRALQRLGSRFENLSGHDRSCILSGQHRTGHCTCHMSSRDSNSNEDTNARASISRIVMLAEALFEVLDEIHQQSVVLSSRPSVSSIGSVPAPHEVVELLPVRAHTKSLKLLGDEAAQCYICLVEYEDGDNLRVLPCNHEFHRVCVDKWLKEIHRVCPLCRGDICKSDSLPVED